MADNNPNIALDRFGQGKPMLLIHGLGGTSNFWRPVINAFSESFDICAPDLPSAGRSALDPHTSIESLAGSMLQLMDTLSLESVHLVGHSMGTIVCQHMAATAPERIRDLVLMGPLAEPPEPAREALLARGLAARTHGMAEIANTIADVSLAAQTKADQPNVQGFVREMVLRQAAEGYALSCEALAHAQRADANRIAARCLLITGDQDGVAPEANVRALGETLVNSDVKVLPACGHWTLTEQPDAVVAAMRNFYDND